jgi:hypothetical protein
LEDEVASDDDKNNIEMIQEQQQEETSFDLPKIQPINFSDMNESQSPAGGDETLMESFILPG